MCWAISCPAHLVVVMGTEYYEGKEHRYIDYAVTDILQMMGNKQK
jgi:replicative superfamily II helicase